MRHQRKTVKLGRSQAHRDALLANQVCSLIEHNRIKTTLAKAKAVRPLAEKMITLGKKKTLHARRMALATLHHNEEAVKKLFAETAPRCDTRQGGYTRIVKLGPRKSDSAPMAFLEWVDAPVPEVEEPAPVKGKKARSAAPAAEAPKAATSETGEKKPARKPKTAKAKPAEESKESAE